MNPLITIAIPTYNNRQTIRRAVESAILQSDLDSVEILVVDNASTDSTPDELRGIIADNFRLERNSSTVPIWNNHNICLQHAKGAYILFCHSDDRLDTDAIKVIKKALATRNYPKRYICWGHSLFRDFSQTLSNSGLHSGQLFAGLPATRPFLNGGLTPSGTLYSRSFLEIGGFHLTGNKLATSDSTSMIWAALCGFRFEMLQELIFHRYSASTYVRGLSQAEVIQSIRNAWEVLLPRLTEMQIIMLLDQSKYVSSISSHFFSALAVRHPKATLKTMLARVLVNPINLLKIHFLLTMTKLILMSHARAENTNYDHHGK